MKWLYIGTLLILCTVKHLSLGMSGELVNARNGFVSEEYTGFRKEFQKDGYTTHAVKVKHEKGCAVSGGNGYEYSEFDRIIAKGKRSKAAFSLLNFPVILIIERVKKIAVPKDDSYEWSNNEVKTNYALTQEAKELLRGICGPLAVVGVFSLIYYRNSILSYIYRK